MKRLLIIASLVLLGLAGCCSGTEEGYWFIGNSLCPSMWAAQHYENCVFKCTETNCKVIDADCTDKCEAACK